MIHALPRLTTSAHALIMCVYTAFKHTKQTPSHTPTHRPQHVLEQGWVVHLPVASPPRKAQEKGRYFRFWDEVYSGGSTYSGISDPGASGSTVTETGEPGQYSVTAGAVQTLAGGGGTARAGVGSSQRGGLRGGGSKGGG